MKKIITTVGTSLITNYIQERSDKDISADYEKFQRTAYDSTDINESRKEKLKQIISKWSKKSEDTGAEIKSIIDIHKHLNEEVEIHLLATETLMSEICADIIEDWFNEKPVEGISVISKKNKVIKGLQVTNKKKFEKEGIPNLIDEIYKIAGGGYFEDVVLNITGGYKALIPFATIIGQVNNIPIYYIFEDTAELIKLPQAPLDINWSIFEKYSEVIGELQKGVEGIRWDDYKRRNNLGDDFQACIYEDEVDGMPILSLNSIGDIFYKKYRNFIIVSVVKGSNYSKEDPTKKKIVTKALLTLDKRLKEIGQEFDTLKDEIIKHTKIQDTFVFKCSPLQLRIQYKYLNNKIELYNYMFITSPHDDKNYSDFFEKSYKNLAKNEMIDVPLCI